MGLEEKVGAFDNLTKRVKEFQDSAAFKLLVSGMHKVSSEYYHKNAGKEGELTLDESKAKALSEELWTTATNSIAVNWLKMDKEKIDTLKDTKDPSSGDSSYDTLMTGILGINKDGFYRALAGRAVVKTQEIDSLIQPIYQGFVQTSTSKMIAKEVKDIKDAQALAEYALKLKVAYPKASESVAVSTHPADTQDAARQYGSVVSVVPRDATPNIAAQYKKAAPAHH